MAGVEEENLEVTVLHLAELNRAHQAVQVPAFEHQVNRGLALVDPGEHLQHIALHALCLLQRHAADVEIGHHHVANNAEDAGLENVRHALAVNGEVGKQPPRLQQDCDFLLQLEHVHQYVRQTLLSDHEALHFWRLAKRINGIDAASQQIRVLFSSLKHSDDEQSNLVVVHGLQLSPVVSQIGNKIDEQLH